MDRMTKKIIGSFSAILLVAAVVLAVFFFMNKKGETEPAAETESTKTEAEILVEKDLDNAYPQTPTEVVKFYWRINKELYNRELDNAMQEKLMKQLRKLYDDEFLAEKANSFKTMLSNFRKDKKNRGKKKIVSAVVEKYDNVEVKKQKDKRKYATIIAAEYTKEEGKGNSAVTFYSYMCRTDADGAWKILGFKAATQQEAIEAGVQ